MKIHINLLLFLTPLFLFGQPAGGNDPALSDQAGIGEISGIDAMTAATNIINQKGWEQGWNETKKMFIAIGEGPIQVPSSHPNFSIARRIAFQKARLDAQAQLAGFMNTEVSRETIRIYEEPSNMDAGLNEINQAGSADPGIIDKTKMLIHAELDEVLASKGISPKSKEAAPVVRELLTSDKFSDVIEASSKAEVAGMFIYDIFESASKSSTGSTAVIAIMSEKTRLLAGAILGKNPSPDMKAKSPIKPYLAGISKDDLIATHGVKTRADENGQLCLLSFGQSKPRTKSSTSKSAASSKARLAALGDLRSFAGELVATREKGGASSEFDEFAGDITELAVAEDFKKITSARAAKLSMPGIGTAHNWNTVDPRSGETIVGVVLKWNLGSAMNANVLRDQMSSMGGSKGGAGVSNLRPAPTSSANSSGRQTSTSQPSSKGFFKSGAQSDDDDF
jgi:hypothetical protein